jgi:hypothetical protein
LEILKEEEENGFFWCFVCYRLPSQLGPTIDDLYKVQTTDTGAYRGGESWGIITGEVGCLVDVKKKKNYLLKSIFYFYHLLKLIFNQLLFYVYMICFYLLGKYSNYQ